MRERGERHTEGGNTEEIYHEELQEIRTPEEQYEDALLALYWINSTKVNPNPLQEISRDLVGDVVHANLLLLGGEDRQLSIWEKIIDPEYRDKLAKAKKAVAFIEEGKNSKHHKGNQKSFSQFMMEISTKMVKTKDSLWAREVGGLFKPLIALEIGDEAEQNAIRVRMNAVNERINAVNNFVREMVLGKPH